MCVSFDIDCTVCVKRNALLIPNFLGPPFLLTQTVVILTDDAIFLCQSAGSMDISSQQGKSPAVIQNYSFSNTISRDCAFTLFFITQMITFLRMYCIDPLIYRPSYLCF